MKKINNRLSKLKLSHTKIILMRTIKVNICNSVLEKYYRESNFIICILLFIKCLQVIF